MCLWILMLLNDLLIPAIMIGFGRIFVRKTPASVGSVFGYRTPMSVKNQDTWQFAHKYCGKLWLKYGLVTLLVTVFAMLFFLGRDRDTVAIAGAAICMLQILPILLPVCFTERALKRQFDEDGERRE